MQQIKVDSAIPMHKIKGIAVFLRSTYIVCSLYSMHNDVQLQSNKDKEIQNVQYAESLTSTCAASLTKKKATDLTIYSTGVFTKQYI